jgi:hypothetical protein
MKYAQPIYRKLVVLELDGVVVHDHTPSELIRTGFPFKPERYEQALDLHEKESAGDANPEEALLEHSTLDNPSKGAIRFTTPKSRRANLRNVFEILFPDG